MLENQSLLELFRELFGEGWPEKLEALVRPKRPGLRINTLKISVEGRRRLEARGLKLTPLPFYEAGFRVDYYPSEMGRLPEHYLGLFYVQDPSSMLPPVVLGPKPGELVLDLAAAPGSKTTQLSAMMESRGLVLANDPDRERLRALSGNLDRMGCLNVAVAGMDGARLARLFPESFDKVLLDAPCTGVGTIHKNPEVERWWSWEKAGRMAALQRRLILAAYDALKPGGRLLYSTCTLTPQENEGVLDWLLRERPEARVLPFEVPGVKLEPGLGAWRGREFDPRVRNSRRVYPWLNPDMEGFFLALVEKPL